VEVRLIKQANEQVLYCRSDFKLQKEQAIMNFFRNRFEEGLKNINASLHKKGGIKKYDKVLERIGRLKEKNFSIAHYYKIAVKHKEEIVKSIEWEFEKEKEAMDRFSGSYFLRTSRMDLNEEEIWSTYNMLTDIENAFRCLKTELGLRPIHHRKESRSDAHLFISILAYHLLHTIRVKLRKKGINMEWRFIRELLSTQVRITTSMTTKDKRRIYIRDSSEPEKFHLTIYNALGLKRKPCGLKRDKGKICSPRN
jgi:transposase